ncbi:MAG: ABC transporter substrate-binding protein [Clostridia bacterium]|nr:ABC transporter substrate-binding protein [Clostridia bacterium]
MKKVIAIALAGALGLTGLALTNFIGDNRPVLKVANWAEYIDGGDEDSPLIHEFEEWYEQQTGKKIRVEYCTADDNEILYNMLKMGDHFDLICPSEYMLMKLIAEDRVQKLPDSFYDTTNPNNYYVNNVSPWILRTFEDNTFQGTPWKDYAAGYMWGTTGFVYNPEFVKEEDVQKWNVFTNADYKGKITAKNNIRDTYFTGLAMHYDSELRSLQETYNQSAKTAADLHTYQSALSELMNDATAPTMDAVKQKLMSMTDNLYGFETDEGKANVIAGKITVNYQWSGDAVYIIDTAEYGDEETPIENPVYLNYAIPDTVSNLWFDGWTLTKDCNNVEAATMFINFLSMPENAVKNMDYIGYTSCIGSDTVFEDFVLENYSAEDGETDIAQYDLNYYFNPNYVQGDESTKDDTYVFYIPSDQVKRQLFAQYPKEETLIRCVAMEYFDSEENTRANSMWSDITFF